MVSIYNNIIFLLFSFFIFHPLCAIRWPYIKTFNTDKDSWFLPKKKYLIRSCIRLKKEMADHRVNGVFSYFFSLPSLYFSQEQPLENILLDVRKKRSTKVHVLLAKAESSDVHEWKFVCPDGFILRLENDQGFIQKNIKASTLILCAKKGMLFLNNKRIIGSLKIHPIKGFGDYNGIIYDGDFIITPYNNTILCINRVELEDYVTAVLRTESWPGWPLEVNKVFAIASRSYVMFKILEAKKSGRPYHVKNTNAHQTYRGKHELALLKNAVAQTKSVVLGFKGAPILAMFDCCCGGIIPAHIEDFDFSKVPYLARTYACNFCKQSSLYSWQVVYKHIDFESYLKKSFSDMKYLSDIHILKKDKAGLVMQIKLKGPRYTHIISGKKLYSLLKEIKSFHFEIQKKAHYITITGRGFGHHLGLCQWGARQMVREGWDYKSILRFYYPNSYFMHLI